MEQLRHRPTPAGELSDQNDVNLASLGERQDFVALGAVVRRAGGGAAKPLRPSLLPLREIPNLLQPRVLTMIASFEWILIRRA